MTGTKRKPTTNGAVAKSSTHPLAACRPRGDRVVVLRDTASDTLPSGIILAPSHSQNKQQVGTVVSVGPGKYDNNGNLVPIGLNPGDRVIITGYAALEIQDSTSSSPDDEYVILREDDVLAVLPK